jgi:hypothetical protein
MVAASTEARDLLASRFDCDRAHAGVGGEVFGGWVAASVVADLGEERRGADHRLRVFEERKKDLPVGVGVDRVPDLAGKQPDLFDDDLERGDEGEHQAAASFRFLCARASGRRVPKSAEQLAGGLAPGVPVAGEELAEASLAKSSRVGRAGVSLQERKADRAIQLGEQDSRCRPEALKLSAELVAHRDALTDELLSATSHRPERLGLIRVGAQRPKPMTVRSREFAENSRVEPVRLPAAGTESSGASQF